MLDSFATARYEEASPAMLAAARAIAPPERPQADKQWQEIRLQLEQRLYGLRNWRLSWWQHWARLAENILPRRYHWLVVPNNMTRGMQINQAILDPTGTQAMRVCAAGMMSGLTNPARPWFKLKPGIAGAELDHAGQLWFDEVESRIYTVMSNSNYYDAKAQGFEDLVVFGTAPMLIYEDRMDIVRCFNPCAGEYYLATGSDNRVDSFYRTYVQTVAQVVEMFGLENCGSEVQGLWATKGAQLETEVIVAHAIEPNFPMGMPGMDQSRLGVVPGGFTFREYYWLWGKQSQQPLSVRGFREKPFSAPRWATTSNDAYGRSPAMDALPDILQLQVMTRRFAEAVEKMVRPPMQADAKLRNQPASTLPGKITYVGDLEKGGMKPIFLVDPKVQEMSGLIKEIQNRIGRWFYNDLFLMISQMEGVQPRNELEIAERRGEKLQVLGPVVEKYQGEGASEDIKRIVSIMQRRRLIPPRPPSLAKIPVEIEYISMFSLAQRAAQTAGMERSLKMAVDMNQVWPGTTDNVNPDKFWTNYADKLAFPADAKYGPDQVKANRAARQKQEQAQNATAQAAQVAPVAADTAKTLSDTDVGGGLNALQMMLGQNAEPAQGI